jgi:hypothetical protein
MSYFSAPGIFNVLDPWWTGSPNGMQAGPVSAAQAETNAQILQAAINAAQQDCGSTSPTLSATILIPGNSDVPPPVNPIGGTDYGAEYYLAVPSGGSATAAVTITCYYSLLFLGTGNCKLTMVANTEGAWGDMFDIGNNAPGNVNIGGVTFQDLHLSYQPVPSDADGPFTAINVISPGAQNIRLYRVIFDDCPYGVWFNYCLQGSMLECTSVYANNTGNCVTIGNTTSAYLGKEIYIAGCVLTSNNGGIGIFVGSADHLRVSDTRIDGFYNGIVIEPDSTGQNVVRCSFTDVTVYTGPEAGASTTTVGTALTIAPQNAAGVGDVSFVNCEFETAQDATNSAGPGVFIDQGESGTIDTVRFLSCSAKRWFASGMELHRATHIEIIGGIYSANNPGVGTAVAAGIAIVDAAKGVRIDGVAAIGSYSNVQGSSISTPPAQEFGIYFGDSGASTIEIAACDLSGNSQAGIRINDAVADVTITACNLQANTINGILITGSMASMPTSVFIRNCDFTGFANYSDAINVSGFVSNLEITNCPGYNDTAITLLGPAVPPTGTFHNYSLASVHGAYYGPIAFYIWGTGVSHVHIDGNSTGVLTGGFVLGPGERAEVDYTGSPSFLAVGK